MFGLYSENEYKGSIHNYFDFLIPCLILFKRKGLKTIVIIVKNKEVKV